MTHPLPHAPVAQRQSTRLITGGAMVRHHPGAPRAGSPIRRLPSRGGDLLRGKRAPVGGESCGYWNGLHETTMALLYTIRSAKPTSVEDTTVPQTRSLRQHLLLTWADVSKERPPLHADVAQLARESVAPHADRSPVRVRPSAAGEWRGDRYYRRREYLLGR